MNARRHAFFALLTLAALPALRAGDLRFRGENEANAVSETSLPSENAAAAAALTPLTSDFVLNDLARQLTERYHPTGDLQLDFVRAWTAPAGAMSSAAVVVVECPAQLTPTLLVRIRIQGENQILADTTLQLRAQLLREVWATRSPVERGAPFEASLFETRRVDVLRERDTVSTLETSGEMSFTRSVPAGRLVTWRDLTRKSLVRKGQVIEVCATSGTMTVTIKALAMENGSVGDVVRIRNLESKKEFSAQVTGDARAEVRL